MSIKKGFTLVELLIAVGIFGVVAISIYSSFGAAIKVWRHGEEIIESNQNLRLGLNEMSKDLKNIIFFDSIEFEAQGGSVTFPSLSGDDIIKISYNLDGDKGVLIKATAGRKDGFDLEAGVTEELISTVKAISFSFPYEGLEEYECRSEWDSELGIPRGIKIKVDLEDGKGIMKTVFIPMGVLGANE